MKVCARLLPSIIKDEKIPLIITEIVYNYNRDYDGIILALFKKNIIKCSYEVHLEKNIIVILSRNKSVLCVLPLKREFLEQVNINEGFIWEIHAWVMDLLTETPVERSFILLELRKNIEASEIEENKLLPSFNLKNSLWEKYGSKDNVREVNIKC